MTTNIKQVSFLYKTRIPESALKVGRFLWHYAEMLLAMGIGGFLFSLLLRQISESSSYAAVFARGTYLRAIVSSLFMTVPMVAWMILRGHSWRHSWEMTGAMLAPVAAIIVLRMLGADPYLPWIAKINCPAMDLAMLVYMLYHRDHYTGATGHSAHSASAAGDPSCHTS
jgi:energy-converting hydrogenase Eha subunit A